MKICIVTTRHISYNPRVLKEADALHENGHDVVVVTINNNSTQHRFDTALMQKRGWKLQTINFRKDEKQEKLYWFWLSLVQNFFTKISALTFGFGIVERAVLKGFSPLLKLAKRQQADLYIAHHAEALGIASKAADFWGVPFAFDAEDFHTGMNESGVDEEVSQPIAWLEAKYLPKCTYISAASTGIGRAYENKYVLSPTETILNVFPTEKIPVGTASAPVRFYWYSQVIGPNRSLEVLLDAAARIQQPFELHLRGDYHNEDYRHKFLQLIADRRLSDKVFVHPPILAEEIIRDAAQFDVGLALESAVSENRNICVTNKIFSYLMSGLAIVGTDTAGQKEIFSHFGKAVKLCTQNDPEELATAMRYFIDNIDELIEAKTAARNLALERYNWEVESKKLLTQIERLQKGSNAGADKRTKTSKKVPAA